MMDDLNQEYTGAKVKTIHQPGKINANDPASFFLFRKNNISSARNYYVGKRPLEKCDTNH